jgi:hypothetical protein
MSSVDAAELVLARCSEPARCTEEPGRLTRRFATPALREAGEAAAGWMRQAAVEAAHELPFALEVYGFAAEEGTRYGTSYLASRVVAGSFDPALLERFDADGVALADALRAFGGDPDGLSEARRVPTDLIGYCEVHIEQGPVLETRDTPLGVVTGIAGQWRCCSCAAPAGSATIPTSR